MTEQQQAFRRWYDHDPLLIEVLDVLKDYEQELHSQAEHFLEKITQTMGEIMVEQYYQAILKERELTGNFGNRWYDQDPVLSKAVELLRIAPPEAQRQIADNFLTSLAEKGLRKN